MSKHLAFHDSIIAGNGGNWVDFERLVRDIYVSILKPGDVTLDVGVNRGDHLLQMIPAVGPSGLVIGVEAAPSMVALVQDFLSINHFDRDYDVILHNCAVSDKEGITKFHFVKDQPGLSSLADREVAREYDVEIFDVPVTTLDTLLKDVDRTVSFVKLDIEGAEYHALLGAKRLLERDRPPIVFEFNDQAPVHFGYKSEDILHLFHSYGYTIQDFFGFSYSTPRDLTETKVWNYFAAPSEQIERFEIPALVKAKLLEQDVVLPSR